MPITKASGNSVTAAAKGDLVVGNATNDSGVLSVGANNTVLTADSSTATGLKWSAPASTGYTWTGRAISASNILKVAYNGSLFVAGGSSGVLLTSTNGTTWTSRTSGFGSNGVFAIIYNTSAALWIIGGDNGSLATSPDGVTWTLRTSNMSTNQINDFADSGSTIVGVGRGGGSTNTGGIIYSTNGTTWTRKSQTPTIGTSYNSVVYNGTNWVVGANNSTNNYLYASDPSSTWTAGQTGNNGTVTFIAWDGTRHIIVESTEYYYSTSTTVGTPDYIYNYSSQTIGGESVKRTTSYYNGRIYQGYTYLTDTSTTPTSTNYWLNQGQKNIPPSGSGLIQPTAYFVCSAGQVLFSNYILFTSF
jgi:hypothetical protein